MNDVFIYCCTHKALYNYVGGGGLSSTTTSVQHPFGRLGDHHVLVRTNNISVIAYINHQGGLRSCPLYRLARQILVWAQGKLCSLRAVYIPGHLNMGADTLLRQGPRPWEWMLHPDVVKQIWRVFGQAQVNLFATQKTVQCPLWYSHWGWMLWYRLGRGFVCMPFPRSLCSQEFWEHLSGRSSIVLGPDFSPRRLSSAVRSTFLCVTLGPGGGARYFLSSSISGA